MGCTHIGLTSESVVSDLSLEKKCKNASQVTAPSPACKVGMSVIRILIILGAVNAQGQHHLEEERTFSEKRKEGTTSGTLKTQSRIRMGWKPYALP